MLTRNMLCPLIYANMKLNKASNIAVHFSVFGSLSLIYRIKNNLKLLQLFLLFITREQSVLASFPVRSDAA